MKPMTGVYLLDTSALLSFIEDEEGADRVEKALKQKETLLPWPVLLEMVYITLQEEGQSEADKRFALIKQLKVKILYDMDEATLLTAARLKAFHRISLADAVIAAYAFAMMPFLCTKTRNLRPYPVRYPWNRSPINQQLRTGSPAAKKVFVLFLS